MPPSEIRQIRVCIAVAGVWRNASALVPAQRGALGYPGDRPVAR